MKTTTSIEYHINDVIADVIARARESNIRLKAVELTSVIYFIE